MSGVAQGSFQKALIARDRDRDRGGRQRAETLGMWTPSNGSLDTGQELADWMDSATRIDTFLLLALKPNLPTPHLSQMLAG